MVHYGWESHRIGAFPGPPGHGSNKQKLKPSSSINHKISQPQPLQARGGRGIYSAFLACAGVLGPISNIGLSTDTRGNGSTPSERQASTPTSLRLPNGRDYTSTASPSSWVSIPRPKRASNASASLARAFLSSCTISSLKRSLAYLASSQLTPPSKSKYNFLPT